MFGARTNTAKGPDEDFMTQTTPQISTTPSGAAGWVKWHAWNERAMQPVTSWICDTSAAKAGEHVLDLGCGTGLPSLALAARVQPNGQVTAIDVSPEMVEAARQGLGSRTSSFAR